MKIVTGHGGTTHITSNDFQGFNQGVCGTGSYVFDMGTPFAATILDATHIEIGAGEGVMQGVHFRIESGEIEEVEFDGGVTGMNRVDLIVARYTKNETTTVEKVELAVIKGTATSGTPVTPDYTVGDILGGDDLAEFPLYKITLTGVTPELTTLFCTVKSLNGVTSYLTTSLPALYFPRSLYKELNLNLTVTAGGERSYLYPISTGGKKVYVMALTWAIDSGILSWCTQNVDLEGRYSIELYVVEGESDVYNTSLSYDIKNYGASDITVKVRVLLLELDY